MSPGISNSERDRLQAMYAEIATLAGGLAHEIRNPLSTIGMNLELLAEDIDEIDDESSTNTHRIKAKIQTLQKECRHLEDILNEFLQFAKAGELDPVLSDLNALVTDFIEFYQPQAAEKAIDISPHLDADLPLVAIDKSLFRQVLMNLVQNAEQAMPGGGLLEFQTVSRNDRVDLELIDNGCGMNEQTVSRIFRAFFSTRSGGSGLGLPTVKKIVEAHLATISVESEPGSGTRFTISFPVADTAV